MRILRWVNFGAICVGAVAIVVTWAGFSVSVISGERTLGGCGKCQTTSPRGCTSLDGYECHNIRNQCIGYNVHKRCQDEPGVSECSWDQKRCANEANQICVWI